MGYWLYYLACIALAFAVDRPWLALLGLVFVVLRPFLADPIVFLDTVSDILDLREQLVANPADVKTRRDLACLWLRRERPRRALALLEEADKRDPGNADTLYLIGLARLHADDAAGALDPVVRAADIDPRVRFGEPYLVAGLALMQLQRFNEAEDALEHYTRVNSSSVRGFCLLAAVRAALGEMVLAREALAHARSTYREVPPFKRKGQLGTWLFALSGGPLLMRSGLFRRVIGASGAVNVLDGLWVCAVLLFAVGLLGKAHSTAPSRWPPRALDPTVFQAQENTRDRDGRNHVVMSRKPSAEQSNEQGVALVRQVIEKVKAADLRVLDPSLRGKRRRPRPLAPEVIASLRLPGDRPLSPSLAEWLAFDASFFGWFKDPADPVLPEMNIGEGALAAFEGQEFESQLAAYFNGLGKGALPGLCLPLPFGDQSRRLVYLSEPDALGEYPVLLIDVDDRPYVGLEYPGIDVFLATHAGLVAPPENVAGSYMDDPRFRERMEHHLQHTLRTRRSLELGDEGFPTDPARLPEGPRTPPPPLVLAPGEPAPPGYRVVEGINPFTKQPMRFLKPIHEDEEEEDATEDTEEE